MKIIISPAKKLTDKKNCISNHSLIQFSKETKYLVDELRNYTVDDIKILMGLSDSLAKLNYLRYQKWDLESKEVDTAIHMFKGDVYKGLNVDQLSEDNLLFAQQNLRIISGLYGLLKPLDLIFPYRLEMGTKIITREGKNLYEFWSDKLYSHISSEMQENETLVNLASNEYSKALKLERFKQPIITPIFKDYKNGKLKVISFFAKKARGEMVNFIIKNKIIDSCNLKLFSNLGYKFSDEDEKGNMLFIR